MTTQPRPADLLADLESRQDELLRLLAELEERTQKALAQLSPAPPPEPKSGSTPPAATPRSSPSRAA